MIEVEMLGNIYEFPDDTPEDVIKTALDNEWQRMLNTQPAALSNPAQDDFAGMEEMEGLLPLNDTELGFASTIGEIETGGLENRFIRTKMAGTGSSAYGPYQITRGLLRGTLKNSPDLFDEQEREVVEDLIARQSVSLAVGGSDRKKYEKGGLRYGQARKWATQYGFDDVNSFLDAFDYGGDFGLSEDGDFMVQYENIGRKLLRKHLTEAGGDAVQAAAVWHGGPNWKRGKHRKQTQAYISKYRSLTGE